MGLEEILLSAVINAVFVGLTVAFTTYILTKTVIKNTKKELKTELEQWINSEKGQKAIYVIGGLLASGIKGGLNVPKGSGKFSIEGLVGNLLGNFIQKQLGVQSGETSQNQPSSGEKFKTEY